MARAHRLALLATILTAIYLLTVFSVIPVPFVEEALAREVLPLIPWWLLVSFGSYSLWSLGWGLFTFRDCPEAYNELLGEITQAKNELRARGVTVD